MIEVVAAGPLTTVQDLGRVGYAHLGVGRSGAADRPGMLRANWLVGNAASAAALEITLGGFVARFGEATTIALTGAVCGGTVGDRELVFDRPIEVRAGEKVRLRTPSRGLRTYLAARGGIAVARVLGSRATDLLSGLGPPVVAAGAQLPIGSEVADQVAGALAAALALPAEFVLPVLPGPRLDWFAPDAMTVLCSSVYEVTPDSNRVGIRLAGPRLDHLVAAELPPEGMVLGAVQVPPSGQPVLFLADHPATGGYPVIAVVSGPGVALAAQARPGQALRFEQVGGATGSS
jgi:biotin-dependent carboxylase-like uncharacterized protein